MLNKYRVRQILTPLIGSLGVLCSGTTYVWVNPAMEMLRSNDSQVPMNEEQLSWFVAVVEVGDLISTLPSGYLADLIGRKSVLLMTGPLIISTWILVQLTTSYSLMILARILQGLAVGCMFTVTPMYLAEVSDKRVRGMAGTLVQAMWYSGIIFQYSAGPYLSFKTGINIICITPPLIFTTLLIFFPETPRYYLIKNRSEKSKKVFSWLFGETKDKTQLENMIGTSDRDGIKEEPFGKVFIDFFTHWKPMKSLMLLSVIVISNVTGVTPVLSYSSVTFENIGVNPNMFTILMGILSLLTAFIAACSIDKLGRKPLLIFSTISCSTVLFIGGILHITTTGTMIPALCLALYPPLMSLGPGTLTYALMGELFSDKYRGLGSAMVTLVAAVATFVGLKFYSIIESTFGLHVNLLGLSIITISSTYIIYKFIPETKGKTFEEIQDLL